MKYGLTWALHFAVASCLCTSVATLAQENTTSFYAGKTIRIIVGPGPGGGYDLYARLLARHFGDHIPGNPTVVVENLAGGGDVRAANYVYAGAPKDGTFIVGANQAAAMFQMLGGKGAQYDPIKFQWLGSIAHSNNTIFTSVVSGIKTLEDAKAKEVPMAGSGIISDADIYPAVFNALVGTKFKVINGYTGTADSDIAVERGEVAGRGGGGYATLVGAHSEWLRDKKINILAQIGLEKEPELPNVPLLQDLVEGNEAHEIASIVTLPTAIGDNYWLSPEVPKDRVAILIQAFEATVSDPALIAEAQHMGFYVRPKRADELRTIVEEAAKEPKTILQRTAAILGW